MALSKKGKKNKKVRVAAKRAEKRKKQEANAEERKADRVARGLPAVAPKPPKKRTTWSGQDAPLPPPQLIDRVHEWLRDYRYIKAAHGVRTDNQKRPGHNMMLWKGTSDGMPQLNEIFLQWKEQNPELAIANHEREAANKTAASDDASDDSDSDSVSDSDESESEDEDDVVEVNGTAAVAVNAGTKRKADEISDDSSSSDSDSSSEDSTSDSDNSDDAPATTKVPAAGAGKANGSDSSTTVGRKTPEAMPQKPEEADGSSSSSSSAEESNSDSDSDDSSGTSSESSSSSDSDAPAPKNKSTANGKSSKTTTSSSTLTGNGAPATKRTEPNDPTPTKGNSKPFSRIPEDIAVDPRFSSNAYVAYDYADKAHADLSVVRGRGFTKEKNKKKRGQGFRGGAIDTTSRAVKFDD